MITQCPNCATSFRVSSAQLAVAEGAVRCGACLQVFPADQHMIPVTVDHHSELQLERQSRLIEAGTVAEMTASTATAPECLEGPLVLEEMDRSIGEYDSVVDDALNQEADGRTVPLVDVEEAIALAQLPADQLSVDSDDQANADLLSADEKRSVAYNLSFEPDEIEIHSQRRSMLKWCGWTLLNLLMILSLAGQFGWFHQAELSQQEELRGWYELLCNLLQCELVDFTDVTKIKTRKLVIRSHPDVDEALIVDAIIFNDSQFAQPFPLLYLSFTDIENKLVASRRFKPVEYLAGELTGSHQMPAQTEVHLSLEIVDPGTSAVSYQLKVVRI